MKPKLYDRLVLPANTVSHENYALMAIFTLHPKNRRIKKLHGKDVVLSIGTVCDCTRAPHATPPLNPSLTPPSNSSIYHVKHSS